MIARLGFFTFQCLKFIITFSLVFLSFAVIKYYNANYSICCFGSYHHGTSFCIE